ncbi:MAG: hypothetical protein N2039_00225, partial [Gemmataceae bacterium]|nr:hypothetical protein [Gemmataceae bacterium]
MIATIEPAITVDVDVTNPGQFFACCGLLALADRLWPDAEGMFSPDERTFLITCGGTLDALVRAIASAELIHSRPADPY